MPDNVSSRHIQSHLQNPPSLLKKHTFQQLILLTVKISCLMLKFEMLHIKQLVLVMPFFVNEESFIASVPSKNICRIKSITS